MEMMSYMSPTDWFTHYLINNALWVPFELRVLLIGVSMSFIYLVLKKMMW